jgi:hypothetical protein
VAVRAQQCRGHAAAATGGRLAGAGRSFRSGLQAAVWTVTAMIPLTYAIWLPEGLRRHAIDGRLLVDGEVVAPVGGNLADVLVFCLGIVPVLGLTLAVIGAGLGSRTTHRAVPDDPSQGCFSGRRGTGGSGPSPDEAGSRGDGGLVAGGELVTASRVGGRSACR